MVEGHLLRSYNRPCSQWSLTGLAKRYIALLTVARTCVLERGVQGLQEAATETVAVLWFARKETSLFFTAL